MQKIKIKFTDFYKNSNYSLIRNYLENEFDFIDSDSPDFVMYSNWGYDYLNYDCCRISITMENARTNFWDCDYAIGSDYSINPRYYRLPNFVYWDDAFEKLILKKDIIDIFNQKQRFCDFIYSNKKAKTRILFLEKLSKYKKVDTAGAFFKNIAGSVPKEFSKEGQDFLVSYRQKNKFSISFENASYPGYTTEKIYHAFLANTVPIYWGNPQIAKDFNPKAFINCHTYKNFDAVIKRIIEVDQNDDLYLQYLAEPCFINNEIPKQWRKEEIIQWFQKIFNKEDTIPVAKTWKGYSGKIKKQTLAPIRKLLPETCFFPFPFYRYTKMKEWSGKLKYLQYEQDLINQIKLKSNAVP